MSTSPVETVTTFFRWASGREGSPESWPIETPANPGWSGWTTGSCSFAADFMSSVIRTMSRPSSGVRRSPNRDASAMTYHIPPHATSTVTVPSVGTSIAASRCAANAGTLRKVTPVTFPS